MKWSVRNLVAVLAACSFGCGGKQPEGDANSKQSPEQAVRQIQGATEALAAALEGAAGATSNQKPALPLNSQELQSVLPRNLSGWSRGEPSYQMMTTPVSFSEASVTFTKGDAALTLRITDTSFNQALLAPFSVFLSAGYENRTADGYERTIKRGDSPGWVKWSRAESAGELNVLVGGRFLVQIEGSSLADDQPLSQLADTVNLKHLADLR